MLLLRKSGYSHSLSSCHAADPHDWRGRCHQPVLRVEIASVIGLDERRLASPIILQIHTVGVGVAIGQSCMLLSAGTKGKRFMLPHATGTLLFAYTYLPLSRMPRMTIAAGKCCMLHHATVALLPSLSTAFFIPGPAVIIAPVCCDADRSRRKGEVFPSSEQAFGLRWRLATDADVCPSVPAAMLHQPRVPPTGQRQAVEIAIKWKEVLAQKTAFLKILERTTGHSTEKLDKVCFLVQSTGRGWALTVLLAQKTAFLKILARITGHSTEKLDELGVSPGFGAQQLLRPSRSPIYLGEVFGALRTHPRFPCIIFLWQVPRCHIVPHLRTCEVILSSCAS